MDKNTLKKAKDGMDSKTDIAKKTTKIIGPMKSPKLPMKGGTGCK